MWNSYMGGRRGISCIIESCGGKLGGQVFTWIIRIIWGGFEAVWFGDLSLKGIEWEESGIR